MCFVLYAGTTNPIPRRKWDKDAPGLSVESLTDWDAAVKVHFSNPEVQYIGSTSRCGCAFPHAMFQNFGWPEIEYAEHLEEDAERASTDRYNKEALVDLLRASGEKVVELYGIWDGDFAELPEAQESIAVEEIFDPAFRFKERGFYRVAVERADESKFLFGYGGGVREEKSLASNAISFDLSDEGFATLVK